MQNRFTEWGDVRVFLAVVHEGSTLAASRVLGINQTTVARRIDVLEHVLGFSLFEKTTRGSRPTDNALAMLADAKKLETSAQAFMATASKQKNKQESVIRITAVIDAFNEQFSGFLSDFTEARKDVRFELIPSDAKLDVASGQTDVALRMVNANTTVDPTLICHDIFMLEVSLFASRGYVEKFGMPASPDDFADHNFLVFDGILADHPGNRWVLSHARQDQIAMAPRDMLAMTTALEMGAGLGMLTRRSKSLHSNLGECYQMPDGYGSMVKLMVNPTAYKRKEVQAFTEFFVPRYRDYYQNS